MSYKITIGSEYGLTGLVTSLMVTENRDENGFQATYREKTKQNRLRH